MNKKVLRDFVPFPRDVMRARRDGRITPNEFDVYVLTRYSADPFGNATVSLDGLAVDLRQRAWGKNYINKKLLSLVRKRFLHYPRRSGRSGSFEIHFAEFSTPTQGITQLPETGSALEGSSTAVVRPQITAEQPPRSYPENHRLEEENTREPKAIRELLDSRVRASYTDIENIPRNNRSFEQSPITFRPKTREEEVCRAIAIALGEKTMSFLLGSLKNHGFPTIEETWGIYRHDIKDKNVIENKGAYFNTIFQGVLNKRNNQ